MSKGKAPECKAVNVMNVSYNDGLTPAFSDKHWSSLPAASLSPVGELLISSSDLAGLMTNTHTYTHTPRLLQHDQTLKEKRTEALTYVAFVSCTRSLVAEDRTVVPTGKHSTVSFVISSVKLLNARAGMMIKVVSGTDLLPTAWSLQRENHSRASVSHQFYCHSKPMMS